MMSIKAASLSILLASLFGGGIGYIANPTQGEMEKAIRQAQEMSRDCMPARTMPKGPIYNSPGKDY